jgi:UDP-N-acetylglucosamine 2-epimerase (non-hydrolysing)
MIHVLLGTRAQLIKTAPILLELQRRQVAHSFILLNQHRTTMDDMIKMFDLRPPDVVVGARDTDITQSSQMILWSLKVLWNTFRYPEKFFGSIKPGIVAVHGDAPPALLGALMARRAGLAVAHVESGLRSFRIFDPFPEELVRCLTFALARYYFSPGATPLHNLRNYSGVKVDTQYNTLYDALQLARACNRTITIPAGPYCIFTSHRFENINSPKRWNFIVETALECAHSMRVLFIMHPVTKVHLEKSGTISKLREHPQIEFRDRLPYFDFIHLLDSAQYICTDGGSNQEESFYLGKPCLILRERTEREDGLGKNAVLSGFSMNIVKDFLSRIETYQQPPIVVERSPTALIVDALIHEVASLRAVEG